MLSPRPRLSPATAMADTAVDTAARGLLMPSPRLMLLLRPDTAMAVMAVATEATVVVMVVMAVTAVATDTARGRLRLSPATTMAAAMVVTVVVMEATVAVMEVTDTARGLLSPATAMAVMAAATVVMAATATAGATATGVSYHRIRRSELSQKQNHKNSQR